MNIALWTEVKKRLLPETWPEIKPSFTLKKGDKVFTIGSCFARNIEEHLARYGFVVPMLSFIAPRAEMGPTRRPNGILNKFSPAAIWQEIDWTAAVRAAGGRVTADSIAKYLYERGGGLVIDLGIGGYIPVTRERALARRQEIYDVFTQLFSSQAVVMTLGLVEVWYDLKTERYIQRMPNELMPDGPARFKFVRLHYADCYDFLQRSIALIREHNPGCKFLLTTSPVPLKRTFTADDVIVANNYSKSVLRAVCGELAEKNTLVDYFPAYESATLGANWGAYQPDLRQVKDEFVKKIVARLAEKYFA